MNSFKTMIASMAEMILSFRKKGNAALLKLEPIDQHELAPAVKYAISDMQYHLNRMNDLGDTMDGIEEKLSEVVAAATEESITAQIGSGDLFKKETVEADILAARAEEKGKVEEAFQARLDDAERAGDLRIAVVSKHGAVAAATLTDENLLSDGSKKHLKTLASRITTLSEHNVTEQTTRTAFVQALACGYDSEGDAKFASQVEVITALANKPSNPADDSNPPAGGVLRASASNGDTPPATPPSALAGNSRNSDASGEDQEIYIF